MAHVVLIRRDVVDDGIDAAILDFEERLIDGVEHADIGPRDLARGLLTRRADRDAERLALQVFCRVDCVVVRPHDDTEARDVVRLREVDRLLAIVRDRDVIDCDIDFLGLQRRDQAIKGAVADLDVKAFLCTDGPDDVDIKALVVLRLLILRAERRIARIHADAQHLLSRLPRRVRLTAACRQCRRAEQADCQ